MKLNIVPSTNYTFVAGDADTYVRFTAGTAVNATVPPNSSVAYPIGTEISFRAAGEGQVTIASGSGVTIYPPRGGTHKLRGRGSTGSLLKVATNEWDLVGDLEAAS